MMIRLYIMLVVSLCLEGCASASIDELQYPDRRSLRATVIRIEPFPFAENLSHHAAEQYWQGAWVSESETRDSLALVFGYEASRGTDIRHMLRAGVEYEFVVSDTNIVMPNLSRQGSTDFDSLAVRSLIQTEDRVISDIYLFVHAFTEASR